MIPTKEKKGRKPQIQDSERQQGHARNRQAPKIPHAFASGTSASKGIVPGSTQRKNGEDFIIEMAWAAGRWENN